MSRYFIIFLFYANLFFFYGNNVNSQCFTSNNAFIPGEKLNYIVYYNMAFIWVEAGKASFNVATGKINNTSALLLNSYGTSLPKHDWFFKVRESYVSYLDSATLLPIKSERKAIEGSYWTNELYYFDHNKKLIYSAIENAKQKFKRDTLKLQPCILDAITVIYYCRNLDFSTKKVNDKFPVTTLIDNKVYKLHGRYLGKETIELRDKTKYKCNKFKAMLVEGTIFKGGEDLTVWASDDENQIPIMIQADILVGSIKVYFTGGEGLKYKLDSKIQNKN